MNITIPVALSVESIQRVIEDLTDYKEDIQTTLGEVIQTLAAKGAIEAQKAYGNYPVTVEDHADGLDGDITVTGDMPMIAEFGAGDATLSGGFTNTPAEARPGSWSETHAQQYSRQGYWIFNGVKYTKVEPHRGLYEAMNYIKANSTAVAKEVFG